jgi:hypothetical protein
VRRERAIQESREVIERVNQKEREWKEAAARHEPERLKRGILRLVRSAPHHPWTREEMMSPLGYNNLDLISRCLDELVRDALLKKVDQL